jgi:hypothetical protein
VIAPFLMNLSFPIGTFFFPKFLFSFGPLNKKFFVKFLSNLCQIFAFYSFCFSKFRKSVYCCERKNIHTDKSDKIEF